MLRILFAALPLVALPLAAQADTPNIQPGLWENQNTMIMEGMAGMPDQTETTTECVTQEEIDRGENIIEAPEGCTLDQMDMTADRMDYTMSCTDPQGGQMQMEGSMRFMGDRAEGEMTSEMDTPMGPMNVRMETRGQRIGDC
ncbi:DUF3617 domain-containing protein [Thioalkalivibrio sp. ALE30]|uniref:DUF3617 domain-containing protein n=1 Tax=Thioalkalivibrio sp. ALE30 TaxID=1158181 RepID=UPI000369CBEA|nr:DUF3617 domain-containing protein [Thioalkalivibrio sp. ALE30]